MLNEVEDSLETALVRTVVALAGGRDVQPREVRGAIATFLETLLSGEGLELCAARGLAEELEPRLRAGAARLVERFPDSIDAVQVVLQLDPDGPSTLLASRGGKHGPVLLLAFRDAFERIAASSRLPARFGIRPTASRIQRLDGRRVVFEALGAPTVYAIDIGVVLEDLRAARDRRVRGMIGTVLAQDLDEEEAVEGGEEAEERDPLVGTLLDGKYQVLRRLGEGGFGCVYEARDLQLDHSVAIKVLTRESAEEAEWDALKQEARRITRLQHPNIVDWKTLVEREDGSCYFVMELLEGRDLEHVIADEAPLQPRRVARILLQILSALRAAHDPERGGGLLHLDLKPNNVFLVPDPDAPGGERVKVIDFGIGQYVGGETLDLATTHRAIESAGARATIRLHPESFAALTEDDPDDASGPQRVKSCTPEYAAPEHCAHLLSDVAIVHLDERCDIYSVGTLAFEMLTGRLPYDAISRNGYMRIKQAVDAPPVRTIGTGIPRRLAELVDRCLKRDRDERYASTDAAYRAIVRIVQGSQLRRILATAAGTALVAAAALWWWWPAGGPPPLEGVVQIEEAAQGLAGARIALGPVRRDVELRLVDVARDAGVVSLKPVRAADSDAARAFRLRWREGDRLVLGADGSAGRTEVAVFLEATDHDGAVRRSTPFRVAWVPEDALKIERVGVPELGERAVLPDDLRLEIALRGLPDDVGRLWVEVGGKRFPARLDAWTADDRSTHSVALDALRLQPGTNLLEVVAEDAASATKHALSRLDVVRGPLRMERAGLDSASLRGRHSVGPGRTPTLDVALTRPADVEWSVQGDDGQTLASGREEGVLRVARELADLAGLAGGRAYSGTIRVRADESRYVAHAPARGGGVVERTIPFDYWDALPVVSLSAQAAGGAAFRRLSPEEPLFRTDPRVVLRIARDAEVPTRARVRVLDRAGEEVRPAASFELVEAAQAFAETIVPLHEDGAYRVEVEAWHADATAASEPPLHAGTIVLDRTPPELALELPRDRRTLRERDAATYGIRIADRESAFPAPATLQWELFEALDDEFPLGRGLVGKDLAPASALRADLPVPWGDLKRRPAAYDGRYRLVVHGVDEAGNAIAPATIDYEVALSGPDLELVYPPSGTDWLTGAAGELEVRVMARDPNDVARVRCAVGIGPDVRTFELERRSADSVTWVGGVYPPSMWSEAEVEIRVDAIDGQGCRSDLAATRPVGSMRGALPRRIAFGGALGAMQLVRGNAAAPYVFGGRVDELEAEACRAASLGAYNPLSTPRSWRITYPRRTIEDFYLDVDEVSVVEFLAFLDARAGYAQDGNWPGGRAGSHGRLTELRALLVTLAPDEPAVGVTWDEAAAYARWAGKRLPSVVEWEYAVRGGDEYRAVSRPPASPASPVLHGDDDDVTPDTGLVALCSGVSEWTSTPSPDAGARFGELLERLRADPMAIQRPAAAAQAASDAFWIAGAADGAPRRDFSVVDRRGRGWSGAAVGFRCALTAADAQRRLEAASSDPWRIRADSEQP